MHSPQPTTETAHSPPAARPRPSPRRSSRSAAPRRSPYLPIPRRFGQSVTLTATVTGTSPSGTVTFDDGTTPLGTATVDANGQATLFVSTLSQGSHQITAVYAGNGSLNPSTSNAITQVVNAAPPPVGTPPTVVSLQRFGDHQRPRSSCSPSARRSTDTGGDPRQLSTRTTGRTRRSSPIGHGIKIGKATYNPVKLTVTLLPKQQLDVHNTLSTHRQRHGTVGTDRIDGRAARRRRQRRRWHELRRTDHPPDAGGPEAYRGACAALVSQNTHHLRHGDQSLRGGRRSAVGVRKFDRSDGQAPRTPSSLTPAAISPPSSARR